MHVFQKWYIFCEESEYAQSESGRFLYPNKRVVETREETGSFEWTVI